MSSVEAASRSTGVLATHVYTPWSLWLTLMIWRTPSSTTYLWTERMEDAILIDKAGE